MKKTVRTHFLPLFCLALLLGIGDAWAEPVIVHPDFDATPSISQDGAVVAFVSNRSDNREIWSQNLSQGELAIPKQLTDHPSTESAPALNPDGTRLLYVSQTTDPLGDVFLLDLTNNKQQQLTDQRYGETAPTWSPDGKSILYTRLATFTEPQAIILRQLESSQESILITNASSCTFGPLDWLVCSQDGKLVALQLAKPDAITPLTTGLDREPVFAHPNGTTDEANLLFFSHFTHDNENRATLGMARFLPGQGLVERYQLTPEGSGSQHPSFAKGQLYYGNILDGDIHRIDIPKFLNFYQDPLQARTRAASHLALGETNLGLMILGNLSANPERIPNHERLNFDLEYLQHLQEAGWFAKAQELLDHHSQAPGEGGALAGIYAITLPIHAIANRVSKDELGEMVKNGIGKIIKINQQWSKSETVTGQAWLEASRLSLLTGDTLTALEHLTHLDSLQNRELRIQALFARGKIYRQLNDESGLRRVFIQVIRADGQENRWGILAIAQAIAVTKQDKPFPLNITALRDLLGEHPDLHYLGVALLSDIAKIYQENGEIQKTIATLEEIPKLYPDLVPEQKKSLWWKAELLSQQETFAKAAQAYADLLKLPGLTNDEQDKASDLMTKQLVEAAIKQRDLGDPKLAAKALSQILADHPDSIQAHRAYIATKVMLGRREEIINHYATMTKQEPKNPLLQYTHALTLTYVEKPDFKHIITLLTHVTEQVPNNPYFHQTLAWAHEQFEIVGQAEHGHLELAVQEYTTALRLTSKTGSPQMRANLLLNLGNVSFAMKNYGEAYRNFTRWSQLNRPLPTPLESALLYRKLGESAFKTDHTQEAVTLYKKVLELLPAEKKFLRLEMLERLALAHQTLGEHAQAATLFSQALEGNLALNQTENLSLLQRNIGINLYQAALPPIGAQETSPVDRTALQSALTSYLQSLTYLKEHGKKEKETNKGFVSLILSLGENSSQAALGFNQTGEEKLLFGFVSTAYEGLEEPQPALEYLQKKLALITEPLLPDVTVMTEKAVIFNRIGLLYFRLGLRAQALEQTLASLALTEKLGLAFGTRINLYNLSKIAVESVIAHESVNPIHIEHLTDQLKSTDWEEKSPKSAFYTLANTAFLLVNLPEVPLKSATGNSQDPLLGGYYQLYALKGRADSLYRRAEGLLLPNKGFTSSELLSNLIRIKLNRLLIATAAEKSEAAKQLTSEVEQLTQSGLSGTGWILALLQAEAIQDPEKQTKELQQTLKQALALPAPLQTPGSGRVQAPFLEQFARLYTDRLIGRKQFFTAFEVNEKLTMRRISLLLQDQLGTAFFLNGLGEAREEITDLLNDFNGALLNNNKRAQETITNQLNERLQELYATNPNAVAWLHPFELEGFTNKFLTPRRPYLKWVAGNQGNHLFLLTGKKILHATLTEQGELQSEAEFQQILSQAELLILSAPANAPLDKLHIGKLPITRVQTFYDLIPTQPRQGLFYARMALTGPLKLSTATVATAEIPINIIPLNVDSNQNGALLSHANLLIASLPLGGFSIPVGEKNQVTEKISLEKLLVEEGHTAILMTKAELDAPLVAEAFLHAGFAHVILLPDTLAPLVTEGVIHRYLTLLAEKPALLAWHQAWQESGGAKDNPPKFYGTVGLTQAEVRQKAIELYDEELAAAIALQQADDPAAALRRVENGLALIKQANRMEQFTQLTQFAVETLFKLADYPRAIVHQERLLAFLGEKGDSLTRAQALYTLGILYSRLEQFEPAMTHLEAAVKIWTDKKITDKLAEGVATLGVVKENRGAYADALLAFGNSFDLFKQQNNKQAMAQQYLRMGRIYQLRLARYATAKEQFEKALTLFQELDDSEGEAKARLDIGLSLESTGHFAQADGFYQTAIEMATRINDPLLMAMGTLYLANTAWYQGEYQAAFKRLLTAQELADASKDPQLSIMIANTRGLLFWTLNENSKALIHLQNAIDQATKENIPVELASSLNNKGLILRQMGQLDEALALFQQAKAIDTKLQSRWGLGYDHRNIGITLMRMGQLKEAEETFILAESISAEISNPVNQAKALLELGNVNQKLNQPQKAAEFYQRAAQLAQQHHLQEVQWRALAGQAQLFRQQNNPQAALTAYAQAIQVVEGMRAALKIDALRNSFQVDKQDLYREIILLLTDMGETRQAFDYLERFRSRNFIDLLANQKLTLHNQQDEAALQHVNRLFQDLETLSREIAAQKTPDPALRDHYLKQQAAAEEAQLALQQRNPELSGFVSVNPITLNQFEKILEPGVGVLAYLLTEKELLIWLSTASGSQFKRVAVPEKELTDTIRQYRDLMQNKEPVEAVMIRLYQWLIQPMAKEIKDLKYLGIIPHDALHFLAFAALQGPDGPLMEQLPLFYSPSASSLQYALAKRTKEKRTRVLAIGNPDLGDTNFDLPLAEFEADSIRWSFPEGEVLKGKKATKSWIVQNIAKYGIIHIAAHGDFQNINPLFSALWLASSKDKAQPDPEAGHLTVKEIFALELNADLVTLSACQTGLGQLKGSEMIGLNRAFLYAGTHSLISSLWRVDDLSTAVLMKHFYRNYTTSNKADSLRQAQLLVKQSFPHPSNWAGFNLMGDYQ